MQCIFKAAPLDTNARSATVTPFYILGAVTCLLVFFVFLSNFFLSTPFIIIGVVWLAVLSGYLWEPRYYLVTDQAIMIVRLIGKIVIPRTEIQSVEIVDQIPVAGRLFGSGGPNGYYGKFILINGDTVRLYCTRLDRVVVIKTQKGVFVVSPSNPEDFCRVLVED